MKAILFDLDGVLVDTEEMHYLALVEAITRVAKLRLNAIRQYVKQDGTTTTMKLTNMVKDGVLNASLVPDIDKNKQLITNTMFKEIKPSERLHCLLYILGSKYKLGIVSNSRRANVEKIITALGIAKHFQIIVCADDKIFCDPKPAPDLYLHAMKQLGVEAKDTIVFEDSQSGIDAAHKSGAFVSPVNVTSQLTLDFVLSSIASAEND